METKTPLIVETSRFATIGDYIKSLSKPIRKNYKYVLKMNRDLEYREVDFDRELVKRFMELWERQLIRGKNVTWAFREDYFVNINNEGHMLLMAAFRGDEII